MHRLSLSRAVLLGAAILGHAAPVLAQDADDVPPGTQVSDSVFTGDWASVGLGVGYAPSYEGSDDYNIIPAPAVQGSVSGFDFGTRGPGLYVDLLRDPEGSSTNIILGPVARARLDRHSRIGDDRVRALGKLDVAVEVGGTAGIAFEKLLNPYDSLTVSVDALWNVAGAHKGMIVSPKLGYATPLSRALFATVSVSADHVDGDYADYYYSISPAGALASGLPAFRAGGGWKSAGGTALLAYDLDGNLANGGFGLFVLGSYSKMLEDAKRSPITSIAGDRNQYFVAGGISFTF